MDYAALYRKNFDRALKFKQIKMKADTNAVPNTPPPAELNQAAPLDKPESAKPKTVKVPMKEEPVPADSNESQTLKMLGDDLNKMGEKVSTFFENRKSKANSYNPGAGRPTNYEDDMLRNQGNPDYGR